jgi:hypothetical protein
MFAFSTDLIWIPVGVSGRLLVRRGRHARRVRKLGLSGHFPRFDGINPE